MKKAYIPLFGLALLAASCNPFAKPSLAGVSKTVNGGADWQFMNIIKDTKNGTINGANISAMAFDPNNRETVFAGSYNQGLYKSEDSASTWTRILSKIQVYDFAVNPSDTKRIYAAGYYDGFGKVLKTVDGGATWTEIFNEQGQDDPVRTVALNPVNPSQLFAGTAAGNVVRSSDEGVSWQPIKNFNDRIQKIVWKDNVLYVLTRNNGLYRSNEPFTQWDELSKGLTASGQNYFSTNEYVSNFNQLFIDYNNFYVTTDIGLYRSSDGGMTWQRLSLPVKKDAGQVRAVAIAKSSSNVIYTSIGSTIYKSVDGGTSWQTQKLPTTALVYYILIDPNLPQITYAGLYTP